MMKRRMLGCGLASIVALSLLAGAGFAQPKPVVVATDLEIKPFDFAQNGTYVGFDQDLMAEIMKEMGRTRTVKPMDFAALVPALQTGSVDAAMASIFMTDARKQVVDFSAPYYFSATSVLVPEADATSKSIKDLGDKPLAAVTGTAAAKWLKDNMPGTKVSLFPAITGAFLELRAGRVAGVVYDRPALAYYATTEGKGAVRVLEVPVGDQIPVGIAFPKGSALVGPVNAALEKIRADGRYDQIHQKWFGTAGK